MKFLRKAFNDAIRADVIGLEANPFGRYQLKQEKTSRDYLTEEELLRVHDCEIAEGSKLALHRDMFIFAAYAGGLRISDVLQLRWSSFDGSHLHVVITKTGAQVSIKVPNKGMELMCRYKRAERRNRDFIFPVLPANLDTDNPLALDGAIATATTQVNRSLKTLATMADINKRLSFHISRHSFAVMALRKGISIDKVSKLMAHAAIRETQVYAKIVNEELDKAMALLND
jgi:site-specific recombinase XerD